MISDSTGHNPEELHSAFKKMFLPKTIIKINGKETIIDGSTTDLSVSEFADYLMKIQAEVAQMGIKLPVNEEFNKQ
jgi:hypothetical protein